MGMFDFPGLTSGMAILSVNCCTVGCISRVGVSSMSGAGGAVYCNYCRWVRSQSKLAHAMHSPRYGISETEKAIKMSKIKQTKPHYKWSWKLGKAVRV